MQRSQDGNLLYQNNEKSRAWAAMVGLSLPPAHRSGSAKTNVYTESDLVKLREKNPTFYQPAYHGSPHRYLKFMIEHIVDGEGNQTFGYGLYVFYRNQGYCLRKCKWMVQKLWVFSILKCYYTRFPHNSPQAVEHHRLPIFSRPRHLYVP